MSRPAGNRRRRSWRRRLWRATVVVAALALAMAAAEFLLQELFPFPMDRIARLPRSQRVHAADGTMLRIAATSAEERVVPVPLARISPHLIRALVCAEDERFFAHRGVDAWAVARALVQNLRGGGVVSGASTITMQVVRIVLQQRSRSFGFKVEQAFRARQLERLLSKEQILELYCNFVPMGGAVCGFEAAARRWFGTAAADLDLAQSATLVAMLPAPGYRAPHRRPRLVRACRDRLLQRMRVTGAISPAEYATAAATPLDTRRRPWPGLAPHASDYFAGGTQAPVVRTGLDLHLQQRLEAVVAARRRGGADGLAIVVLDRRHGLLRAMIGSPDYANVPLNAATRRRSVGSTLKPFLYALALECGAATEQGLLTDLPQRFGDYRPANFTRDHVGAIGVAQALASSRNLPAVGLLRAVGVDRFSDLLAQLGLTVDPRGLHLDAALGTMAASPLELARAYLRFVEGRGGHGLGARTVERVLEALAGIHTGAGARRGAVAFKTGTSSGRRDAWCVGITEEHVVVCWNGNLTGRGEPGLVGSEAALGLLHRVVAEL